MLSLPFPLRRPLPQEEPSLFILSCSPLVFDKTTIKKDRDPFIIHNSRATTANRHRLHDLYACTHAQGWRTDRQADMQA